MSLVTVWSCTWTWTTSEHHAEANNEQEDSHIPQPFYSLSSFRHGLLWSLDFWERVCGDVRAARNGTPRQGKVLGEKFVSRIMFCSLLSEDDSSPVKHMLQVAGSRLLRRYLRASSCRNPGPLLFHPLLSG